MAFPSNQFISQMPEADGDEVMKHLKENNVEFDLVMAKVSKFQSVRDAFLLPPYRQLCSTQNNTLPTSKPTSKPSNSTKL